MTSLNILLLNLQSRLLGLVLVVLTSACTVNAAGETEKLNAQKPGIIAVDVAIAKPNTTHPPDIFTGTTAPIKEVLLRSQVDGQLQKLAVEVGDLVQQGQVIGKQDDDVLTTTVNQALAEREAQVAEVANARSQVGSARTDVEEARLALVQARGNVLHLQNASQASIEQARLEAQQNKIDAERQTQLAQAGATNEQAAEQARTLAQRSQQNLVNIQASSVQEITQAQTAVKTAEQALQAAEAQVAIEQGTVDAAQKRVDAQQSVLNQAQEQRSYTALTAPLTGIVMERLAEEGNLLETGDEILRLGNFKQIKVIVQVPERLLSQLRVERSTPITLDAFPNQTFTGKIVRISPLANATSRLLPVEIVMTNPGKISSGLLARVNFVQPQQRQVWVPETALQTNKGSSSTGKVQQAQQSNSSRSGGQQSSETTASQKATLFVLKTTDAKPYVAARSVILGERRNGQVEVIQGLKLGESFVSRSSQPLKDGAFVSRSAISESPLLERQ